MGDGRLSGLSDITIGNNTVTFTNSNNVSYKVTGFNAQRGYDLAQRNRRGERRLPARAGGAGQPRLDVGRRCCRAAPPRAAQRG